MAGGTACPTFKAGQPICNGRQSPGLHLSATGARRYGGGMKTAILLLLFAVIGSLFSGLYFVGADKGHTNRAVIALTVRIGLSIAIFGLLMGAHYFGWLQGGRL